MTREYRTCVELRTGEDKPDEMSLVGYAALFNSPSKPVAGLFVERIAPGTFTRSLKEKADVRALFNHDPSSILGRTRNGTLTLNQDERGLRFDVRLNPKVALHRDVYENVKRGDITECSFGFMVPDGGDDWEAGKDESGNAMPLRTLKDVDLLDVSAVTYPQYNNTSVDARMLFPDGDMEIRSAIDKVNKSVANAAAAVTAAEAEKRAADAAAATVVPPTPAATAPVETRGEEEDESFEDKINELGSAVAKKWPTEGQEAQGPWSGRFWVIETHADWAIVAENATPDQYFRISWHEGDDGQILIGDEMEPMDKVWMPSERAKQLVAETRSHMAALAAQHADAANDHQQMSDAHGDAAKTHAEAAEALQKIADQQDRCMRSMGSCDEGDCRCQNRMVDPHEVWDYDDELAEEEGERAVRHEAHAALLKVETRADGKVRTKTVDGKNLTKDKFAFVGDPDKTETWKLPVQDANHARNALARFGQTEGIPPEKKSSVLRKVRAAAKRFGIDVSADDNRRSQDWLKDAPMDAEEIQDRLRRLRAATIL